MKQSLKLLLTLLVFSACCKAADTISEEIRSVLNSYSNHAYSTRETLYNTYLLAVDCIQKNIPGDFIECGVASGAQIAAMCLANKQLQQSHRKIHLFDSFEGIPLAGPNDDQQPGVGPINHTVDVQNLKELLISSNSVYPQLGQAAVCSLENVQKQMQKWGFDSLPLVYHKGWFQNTLPIDAPAIHTICLLRLDGDLYESNKVCLEYLYAKVAKGGYIIIDDYGSLTGCRKAVDEYLAAHNLHPTRVEVPGGLGPVYWRVE